MVALVYVAEGYQAVRTGRGDKGAEHLYGWLCLASLRLLEDANTFFAHVARETLNLLIFCRLGSCPAVYSLYQYLYCM